MIFLQLNDMNSYCHDGVYAFFGGPQRGRARVRFGELLGRAQFFDGTPHRLPKACQLFREALWLAELEIEGLTLAWTTSEAEPLAFAMQSQLSDAEMWQMAELTQNEWKLQRYGSSGFDADPSDHPVWLAHSWLANMRNITNMDRQSYLHLLEDRVVEVVMTQANDEALGSCWDAHLEIFWRQKPEDGGIDRIFLTARQELAELHQDLVLDVQTLQLQLAALEKEIS